MNPRLASLICAAFLLPALCAAADDSATTVEARRLILDPENPERTRVGDLVWRDGLELSSKDGRFGSFSGMILEPDGRKLTLVSDKGTWLAAELTENESGGLTGLGSVVIRPLQGLDGKRLKSSKLKDAESLVRLPDGSFLVGFEGRHRIWRYPASPPESPLQQAAEEFARPAGLKRAPVNGGLEAMVLLPDGRLLALAEDFAAAGDPEGRAAFLWNGKSWAELSYRTESGFKPTAAALLTDRAVLVLERRFSLIGGLAIRLVRVETDTIGPGAILQGKALARFSPPLAIDNMEAMAVRRGPKGETLIYLLSDDNFNPLQRTLLLRFELDPRKP